MSLSHRVWLILSLFFCTSQALDELDFSQEILRCPPWPLASEKEVCAIGWYGPGRAGQHTQQWPQEWVEWAGVVSESLGKCLEA